MKYSCREYATSIYVYVYNIHIKYNMNLFCTICVFLLPSTSPTHNNNNRTRMPLNRVRPARCVAVAGARVMFYNTYLVNKNVLMAFFVNIIIVTKLIMGISVKNIVGTSVRGYYDIWPIFFQSDIYIQI